MKKIMERANIASSPYIVPLAEAIETSEDENITVTKTMGHCAVAEGKTVTVVEWEGVCNFVFDVTGNSLSSAIFSFTMKCVEIYN